MQSTNAKRAGGVIAASETADVLLVPNDSPGGGNFYAGWHQSVKTKANSLPKDVALYLSCLDTNVITNPFRSVGSRHQKISLYVGAIWAWVRVRQTAVTTPNHTYGDFIAVSGSVGQSSNGTTDLGIKPL